jgi:hypothetical protein
MTASLLMWLLATAEPLVQTAPAPTGPFPARPPRGQGRVLSASVSVGPGWLALHDSQGRDGQGALALSGRLGVVPAPNWNVFLGVERTSTERDGATFAQTAATMGVQRFLWGRLYLGGGLALAAVSQSGPDGLTDGPGYGFTANAGVEALRTAHVAFTAELSLTVAGYSRETWEMGGLRVGMVAF